MTLKDELLMYWVFCVVLMSFVARHFLDGFIYLVDHLAAAGLVWILGLLHLVAGHLR